MGSSWGIPVSAARRSLAANNAKVKKPTILLKNEHYDFRKYLDEVNLEKNLFLSRSEEEILKNIEIIFQNYEKKKSYLEHSHVLSKYYNLDNNYQTYEKKISELID